MSKACYIIKDFSRELELINSLIGLNGTSVSVFCNNEFFSDGVIIRNGNKNIVEFSLHMDDSKDVMLRTKQDMILYTTLHGDSKSTDIKNNEVQFIGAYSFKYLTNHLSFETFTSKFRCLIPVEKSELNTFHSQLETVLYSDSSTTHFYDCIRINVNNIQFDIIQLKGEDIGFYIIDAHEEMTFDIFADYCYSIQQSLGFIMGYMPGGNLFYFSENMDFYYTNWTRPTMKSFYYPIHTNPYHFIQFEDTSVETYINKLSVLPIRCFSKLIETIHNNDLFSSIIVMMLEGESLKSLLVKPSIYSVALEGLSKIISLPETGLKYPIGNNILFGEILKEINNIIDSHSSEYGEDDDIIKLKNRLSGLNNPINKSHLTNEEKLIQPFIQLGIKLNSRDINMIQHRNDLLHGNIHLSNDIRQSTEDINDYLAYASAKLYTLVSTLIIKYIGYNGYLVNHAKSFEKYININSDEEYYILI